MTPLTQAEIRDLKSRAQRLEPILKMGKQGLSPAFIKSVDEVLNLRELIKVKFVEFKTERKTLAPELAEKTGSTLVALVGHVAVLYRKNSTPAK
jgi:RNA-binding protein